MKCANCSSSALYVYRITQGTSIYYCGAHLPKFLESRKRAGHLALTDEYAVQQQEALDILSPSSSEAVDPVETPKPVKKAVKKKAK